MKRIKHWKVVLILFCILIFGVPTYLEFLAEKEPRPLLEASLLTMLILTYAMGIGLILEEVKKIERKKKIHKGKRDNFWWIVFPIFCGGIIGVPCVIFLPIILAVDIVVCATLQTLVICVLVEKAQIINSDD